MGAKPRRVPDHLPAGAARRPPFRSGTRIRGAPPRPAAAPLRRSPAGTSEPKRGSSVTVLRPGPVPAPRAPAPWRGRAGRWAACGAPRAPSADTHPAAPAAPRPPSRGAARSAQAAARGEGRGPYLGAAGGGRPAMAAAKATGPGPSAPAVSGQRQRVPSAAAPPGPALRLTPPPPASSGPPSRPGPAGPRGALRSPGRCGLRRGRARPLGHGEPR